MTGTKTTCDHDFTTTTESAYGRYEIITLRCRKCGYTRRYDTTG